MLLTQYQMVGSVLSAKKKYRIGTTLQKENTRMP